MSCLVSRSLDFHICRMLRQMRGMPETPSGRGVQGSVPFSLFVFRGSEEMGSRGALGL